MKAVVLALFACAAVTFAAVGDDCIIAADCAGSCDDTTHHWSCVAHGFSGTPHCECHTHQDPDATTLPTTTHPAGTYVGSHCRVQQECHIHHCESNHCVDTQCQCFKYHSDHGHHNGHN